MWPLPFSTTWLWAGALAVASAGFGVQTVRLARAETEAATAREQQAKTDLRAVELAETARAAAQGKADEQATAFEKWKTEHAPRVATITKEVRNAQQADPVCPDRPLPDGLRDALRRAPAAVGARDASEPGSVPGVGGR